MTTNTGNSGSLWPAAAPKRPSAFPSGGRYVEALQNTTMCFTDPRLRGARVELDRLGLPRPISGNFASVFALTDPAGKRHAIKCFTQNVSDQQQRYTAISRRLAALGQDQLSQPWKMEFEYIDAGILVDGFRWPILKMAWMDGVGLMRWLDDNHHRPELVGQLADRFLRLVADLESAGVAHGDLQHGNLLVAADNTLRLVDYDGMFVDSLAGMPAAEDGHRHYQSPLRGSADFGPQMDRFSAWLIYLSLQALVYDPGLWNRLHDPRGEFLILEQSDLALPKSSPRLSALETSSALGRVAAEQIRKLTASPLAGLPQLAPITPTQLAQASTRTAVAALAASGGGRSVTSGGVRGALGLDGTNGSIPGTASANGALPAWLIDHVGTDPARLPIIEVGRFDRIRAFDFFCFLLTVATCISAVLLNQFAILTRAETIVIAGASVGWLRLGRRYRPEVRKARALRRTYIKLRNHNRDLEGQLAALDLAFDGDIEERLCQRVILTEQRKQLSARRMSELAAVDRECAGQVATMNEQVAALDLKLNQQIRRELDAFRQAYVYSELVKFRIEVAVRELPDLGRNAADKLIAAGIHSAADFTGVRLTAGGGPYASRNAMFILRGGRETRVPSINEHRARVLNEWRERMESRVLRDAPIALPTAREAVLRSVQHERREYWKSGRATAVEEARRKREAVNLEIARTDADLANKINALTMADAQAGHRHEQARRPVEAGLTESRAVTGAYWAGLRDARRLSFGRYLWFLFLGR